MGQKQLQFGCASYETTNLFLRCLQRQAQAVVAVVIVGERRPAQIRLVERDAVHRVGADALVLQLVEVVPLLILLVRAKSGFRRRTRVCRGGWVHQTRRPCRSASSATTRSSSRARAARR